MLTFESQEFDEYQFTTGRQKLHTYFHVVNRIKLICATNMKTGFTIIWDCASKRFQSKFKKHTSRESVIKPLRFPYIDTRSLKNRLSLQSDVRHSRAESWHSRVPMIFRLVCHKFDCVFSCLAEKSKELGTKRSKASNQKFLRQAFSSRFYTFFTLFSQFFARDATTIDASKANSRGQTCVYLILIFLRLYFYSCYFSC